MKNAVIMQNITKTFGKVTANSEVNLEVKQGEVMALVGENGAGKSTLMNILYGLHVQTEGEIIVCGEKVQFKSALDAIKKGIGMVHQHFMLVPRMSVVENIVLGIETKKGIFFDKKEALLKAKEVCEKYKLEIDLEARVSEISLGMQQRVEIIKILYRGADIIILDEPTAVLTPREIDELGVILKNLKEMGKTIIIITHKMDEILEFSDRITVLRQGKNAGNLITKETNEKEITKLMVGKDIKLGGNKKDVDFEKVALKLENISYKTKTKEVLKNISLEIKQGEIIGVAGIDGSGQTELLEIIAGVKKQTEGNIFYNEEEITQENIEKRKSNGVSFIPRDRHKEGLVLDMTIQENMILGKQRKQEFLKGKNNLNVSRISEYAKEKISTFDIRCSSEKQLAGTLSGGNQQKIIIAREIQNDTKLILADQPTRGIDVGAIEFIHNVLTTKRNEGCTILLTSLELDEVMMLSDKIAVMSGGELVAMIDSKEATRDKIGQLMVSKA